MKQKKTRKIRYAVVGQGYISQIAVLPAFKHAKNCELAALVSGEPRKLKELGRKHKVKNLFTYDQYDELLRSGLIDAVYIALPNDQHEEYVVRAAAAGIHVLCEKPMAVTPESCLAMMEACDESRVKLMIAYRLHFERANLQAIELLKKKKIGDPRIINSVFTMGVDPKNYRGRPESEGGGPVFDIGIYCINAARYLFQDEPIEVSARAFNRDQKLVNYPETYSVSMRFPGERLAQFTCSFGAYAVGYFDVVGTKGHLCIDDVYDYAPPKEQWLTIKGKTQKKKWPKSDEFAPELMYFADCILKDKQPEPSGYEGLIDVQIIQAIFASARSGQPVALSFTPRKQRPGLRQEIRVPPVREPEMVDVKQPSKEVA